MESFLTYIINPHRLLSALIREYGGWIPDAPYLQMMYYFQMGKCLNLHHPKTFNEKLQWLKLYDRRPEYTKMVDKYAVKDYVAGIIGNKYIIPTLGVWDKSEEINFESLPNQYVLKTTNGGGSGGVFLCKDNLHIDKRITLKKIESALRSNIYKAFREWPYKNIKPRIIAEKYLCDNVENDGLTDYKFFCFNGYADCVMICIDRQINDPKFYFFDQDWNLLPLNVRGVNTAPAFKLPKPICIQEMFEIAGRLSEGIPFVRVDLYCSDGKPYFGEMTFYPASGFDNNLLCEAEQRFGNLIDLSILNKKR